MAARHCTLKHAALLSVQQRGSSVELVQQKLSLSFPFLCSATPLRALDFFINGTLLPTLSLKNYLRLPKIPIFHQESKSDVEWDCRKTWVRMLYRIVYVGFTGVLYWMIYTERTGMLVYEVPILFHVIRMLTARRRPLSWVRVSVLSLTSSVQAKLAYPVS